MPYEVDKNGYVMEYDKRGFAYKKDQFGNIITYDSNKKPIKRTQ